MWSDHHTNATNVDSELGSFVMAIIPQIMLHVLTKTGCYWCLYCENHKQVVENSALCSGFHLSRADCQVCGSWHRSYEASDLSQQHSSIHFVRPNQTVFSATKAKLRFSGQGHIALSKAFRCCLSVCVCLSICLSLSLSPFLTLVKELE